MTNLERISQADIWLTAALNLQPGNTPFDWQRRLLVRFLDGNVPTALDIPTGLGKTAVMAIWLVAGANCIRFRLLGFGRVGQVVAGGQEDRPTSFVRKTNVRNTKWLHTQFPRVRNVNLQLLSSARQQSRKRNTDV